MAPLLTSYASCACLSRPISWENTDDTLGATRQSAEHPKGKPLFSQWVRLPIDSPQIIDIGLNFTATASAGETDDVWPARGESRGNAAFGARS